MGIAICWALISLVVYRAWICGADHRDFYPRWAGARLLFQGHDLYSLETTRLIQVKLYGQELPPGVDQQAFAYPALIVVELLPFWLLPDVEIAAAAWAGTSIVLIYATISLLYAQARASGIQQPLWAAALLPVWHYSAVMLFQVQFTALPLAALGIGYWAWRRGRDGLAGFVLAWGWIKPELIVLPVIWFILAAWRERRWSFLISLAATWAALLTASFAVAGFWLPGWLEGIQEYVKYAKVAWPIFDAWNAGWLPGMALSLGILFPWWLARRSAHLAFTLSIPMGMLLLPQTPYWGLALLLLPLSLAWQARDSWLSAGVWLAGWLMLLATGVPGWWQVQNALLPLLVVYAAALGGLFADRRAPAVRHPGSYSGRVLAARK